MKYFKVVCNSNNFPYNEVGHVVHVKAENSAEAGNKAVNYFNKVNAERHARGGVPERIRNNPKFSMTPKFYVSTIQEVSEEATGGWLVLDSAVGGIKDYESWVSEVEVEGVPNGLMDALKYACSREGANYNKAVAEIKRLIKLGTSPLKAFDKVYAECSIDSVDKKYNGLNDAGQSSEKMAKEKYDRLIARERELTSEMERNDNNPNYNLGGVHKEIDSIRGELEKLKKDWGYALKDSHLVNDAQAIILNDSTFVKDGVFENTMKRWGFIGSIDDNYKKGTTYIDLDNNGVYDKARLIGYFTNMTDLEQMLKHIGAIHDSMQDSIVNALEVTDGKIVGGEGRSMDGIPYGLYQEGGRSYRGFEITSSENGLRKGVYRFYNWGGGVPFGNSATDGQFTEAQFQKLIGEGKVKLLDSVVADEPKSVRPDEVVKLDPSIGKAIIKIGNTYNVATGVKGNNKSNITWENITMSSPNLNSLLGKDGRIKDSIEDVKQEYVFNWQDIYKNTKERTSIYANTVGEAIRKLADMVALAGVGTANAYVVSVSPNDGYVALYGKLSDLVRQYTDSFTDSSSVEEQERKEHMKDASEYVINWQDRNNGTEFISTVSASSVGEALRKLAVKFVNADVPIERVFVVGGRPVDLYGKLSDLVKKHVKDTKMFKVVDKATDKTLLVKATDSLAAVKRVSSLKDATYLGIEDSVDSDIAKLKTALRAQFGGKVGAIYPSLSSSNEINIDAWLPTRTSAIVTDILNFVRGMGYNAVRSGSNRNGDIIVRL